MKGICPKISRMEDLFIIACETLQKRKEHIEIAEAKIMIKAIYWNLNSKYDLVMAVNSVA